VKDMIFVPLGSIGDHELEYIRSHAKAGDYKEWILLTFVLKLASIKLITKQGVMSDKKMLGDIEDSFLYCCLSDSIRQYIISNGIHC